MAQHPIDADAKKGSFMQRIVVIRHGERRDDAADAPSEVDPPLTVEGRARVTGAADRLRQVLGTEEAAALQLIVSPFTRTRETAEELQRCGIGVRTSAVVDKSICEVFGSVRIKCDTAPDLPLCALSRRGERAGNDAPTENGGHAKRNGRDRSPTNSESDELVCGKLPRWGESIASATQRYVDRFYHIAEQRIARAQVSTPVRGWSDHHPHVQRSPDKENDDDEHGQEKVQARTSQTMTTGPSRLIPDEPQVQENSYAVSEKTAAHARTDAPSPPSLNAMLVTHGDAISAILTYFYPQRIVYEAQYLSFIVMTRHHPRSTQFALEFSHGVSWISEDEAESPSEGEAGGRQEPRADPSRPTTSDGPSHIPLRVTETTTTNVSAQRQSNKNDSNAHHHKHHYRRHHHHDGYVRREPADSRATPPHSAERCALRAQAIVLPTQGVAIDSSHTHHPSSQGSHASFLGSRCVKDSGANGGSIASTMTVIRGQVVTGSGGSRHTSMTNRSKTSANSYIVSPGLARCSGEGPTTDSATHAPPLMERSCTAFVSSLTVPTLSGRVVSGKETSSPRTGPQDVHRRRSTALHADSNVVNESQVPEERRRPVVSTRGRRLPECGRNSTTATPRVATAPVSHTLRESSMNSSCA